MLNPQIFSASLELVKLQLHGPGPFLYLGHHLLSYRDVPIKQGRAPPGLELSEGKIRTCVEAKMFLSRLPSFGPNNQISETECFRSTARLFLTRLPRRRLSSRCR